MKTKTKKEDKDLGWAKRLLHDLEWVIANPALETKAEVRAYKRIRTRLKKAIAKIERGD